MRVMVLILWFAAQSWAGCVDCNWKDRDHLIQSLPQIFQSYLTNGNDPSMRSFFDEVRKGVLPAAVALRQELIARYQGAVVMPSFDAKRLFVLAATDPQSVPPDVTGAMYLTIYEEIRRMFVLGFAVQHQFGIFPVQDYARPLEIVRRMSGASDPYLKAINLYYQGVLLMNQGMGGLPLISRARGALESCLYTAKEKYEQTRILLNMAEADLILGNETEAEVYYTWVLKIDPNNWDGMINLSYLLRQRGICKDPGVWVEASIKSTWQYYDVTIHCGNIEVPEDLTGPPSFARFRVFAVNFLS